VSLQFFDTSTSALGRIFVGSSLNGLGIKPGERTLLPGDDLHIADTRFEGATAVGARRTYI
jgi:hypothetical protein